MRSSMVNTNGITLHVMEEGQGEPVLFCHGFPDTWRGWRRQMEALAKEGYRAIAPDMRGCGRSSAPEDSSQYTPFHTVGDLVGLLDALELSSVIVVGHDWGADVAWNAALLRPDRFTAVFGVSVPFVSRGEKSILELMRAEGRDNFYMFGQMQEKAVEDWADASKTIPGILYTASATLPHQERWNVFDYSSLFLKTAKPTLPHWADPNDVAYTIEEYQRTGFRAALNYYRAIPLSFELLAPFKGARVRQPSYFVLGKEDGLYSFFDKPLEELRKNMPGLRGYLEVEEAGHWVTQEKPEVLNAALVEFLHGLKRA